MFRKAGKRSSTAGSQHMQRFIWPIWEVFIEKLQKINACCHPTTAWRQCVKCWAEKWRRNTIIKLKQPSRRKANASIELEPQELNKTFWSQECKSSYYHLISNLIILLEKGSHGCDSIMQDIRRMMIYLCFQFISQNLQSGSKCVWEKRKFLSTAGRPLNPEGRPKEQRKVETFGCW